MDLTKVGDANRASLAGALKRLKELPCLGDSSFVVDVVLGCIWRMEAKPGPSSAISDGLEWYSCLQIDVVQLHSLQTVLEANRDVLDFALADRLSQLGGDEELLAGHVAFLDGLAELSLGAISLCSIEMTIANGDGVLGHLDHVWVEGREAVGLVPRCSGAKSQLFNSEQVIRQCRR